MRIQITGIDHQLRGVGRLPEGKAAFVPFALPGEEIEATIIEEKERYCIARADEVFAPSALRMPPDCPHYGVCGGCAGRHMRYEATLEYKRQIVFDALSRIGGLREPNVLPTLPAQNRLRNRNKLEFRLLPGGKIGYYSRTLGRDFAIEDCLLAPEKALCAARAASRLCPGARFAVVRANRAGEIQLTVSADRPLKIDGPALLRAAGAASVYFCHLKPRPAHALDGKMTLLAGAPSLAETIAGNEFLLSPQAFAQTDAAQADALYDKALSLLALTGKERVLDAYSGAGTISLALARRAGHVTGVEIHPSAVADAREAARRNGLSEKVEFLCQDAARFARENRRRFDAVTVDPPRRGLDGEFTRALLSMAPPQIVYISCNPATLARDVAALSPHYALASATPVDMFPWTANVETVVLLSKGEIDSKKV